MTLTHDASREIVRKMDADVLTLRMMYVAIAQSLCGEYLNRRAELQKRKIGVAARHVGVEQKLAKTYAPLLLRVREHKGVIEIYWCTVHHGRYRAGQAPRRTIQRYLARGKRPDLSYSLPALLKHAKAWELDLVIDIEARAARLRRCLRECSTLTTIQRKLQAQSDAAMRPIGITARHPTSASGQPEEEAPLPPGVMPTPKRTQ